MTIHDPPIPPSSLIELRSALLCALEVPDVKRGRNPYVLMEVLWLVLY